MKRLTALIILLTDKKICVNSIGNQLSIVLRSKKKSFYVMRAKFTILEEKSALINQHCDVLWFLIPVTSPELQMTGSRSQNSDASITSKCEVFVYKSGQLTVNLFHIYTSICFVIYVFFTLSQRLTKYEEIKEKNIFLIFFRFN